MDYSYNFTEELVLLVGLFGDLAIVLHNETFNAGELILLSWNNDDVGIFTHNLRSKKLHRGVGLIYI